jgi:hypothetical protein
MGVTGGNLKTMMSSSGLYHSIAYAGVACAPPACTQPGTAFL